MERKKVFQENVAAYCVSKLAEKESDINQAKLEYGLTVLFLNLTKIMIVLLLAIITGVFSASLCSLVVFSCLRLNIFGRHASNSLVCTIESCLLFVFLPYLLLLRSSTNLMVMIMLFSSIIICIFAPLYTVATPRKSSKETKKHRILAVLTTIMFLIIDSLTTIPVLRTGITSALFIAGLVIFPLHKERV